ncbi:MAG: AAA family ATPase [Candidatus Aenigmarchaeota archaeon]|nr:AAA family ATPase [Candidatus Aenigmarchaeota archaeon]
MLIEFSVENFRSIKDKITLSMDSSSGKKLPKNLIKLSEKQNLIKSAAIYGPNASGKSNLINSIYFMWFMITQSHQFNLNTKIDNLPIASKRSPFKLDLNFRKKPSRFEIIFIHKDIKYKYGFSCDNEKIIDEYLYYYPKGKEALIFKRKATKDFEFKIDRKEQKERAKQTLSNTLYLSRATQLGYEKTKEPYEFLTNYLVINYSPVWEECTLKQLYENKKLKDKILCILQKADFGNIENIRITKDKRKVNGVEIKFEKDTASLNYLKQNEEDFYDIGFTHKTKEGNLLDFNRVEESLGTRRALSFLGRFFDIFEKGKILIIDEFETSFHPNIVKFLVALFYSKHNKNKAQLIFTTHSIPLLDNELFRKDQIYICSKEPDEGTVLRSLLDFDLKQEVDFERAYLNGRVGGLPFIDETILD